MQSKPPPRSAKTAAFEPGRSGPGSSTPLAFPPIVGVGASAGGLEAFSQLLSALPADAGMAFVLVQHVEPAHTSALAPLLARATKMPVEEIREGMPVEPDRVYVIPADSGLSLRDGLLHTTGHKAAAGRHLPIDHFFSSLAESRGSQAIGVILSGTGSDGTAGIKAIKEAGGATFAQDPESTRFHAMPRNAIVSGCVDLVLPPERIARELARIARHPFRGILPVEAGPSVPAENEDWVRLFGILQSAAGVDFSLYKKSNVKQQLARRMAESKADSLCAYLKILETKRAELDALFEELLVLETEFFHDPGVFIALEKQIFPKIVDEKRAGEEVRVWVAGCSNGAETYSVAISLLECLGDKASGAQIRIFGTDASEKAIKKARQGIYGPAEIKHVPPERVRRYFNPVDGGFQINDAVRDLCVFARQDLTRDPPFPRLDMITCRNVLIYTEPPLQKRILAAFHYGLRPDGILLLGKSESLGSYAGLFAAEDRKNKFFRKDAGVRVPISLTQPSHGRAPLSRQTKESPVSIDLEREATQMVWERYGHAGLVVNSSLQIVHFLGDTSPYVGHAPGRAPLSLMRGLRDEFAVEVAEALEKASHGEPAVRCEGIEFRRSGRKSEVNIEVRPLIGSGPERSFLILFEPAGGKTDPGAKTPKARKESGRADGDGRGQEVLRLRRGLKSAREHLQAMTRDQEATTEELKISNEEAVSSMEELQSTNEELEAAKEELRSINDELLTLNGQLKSRNFELAQLSTDLGNILSGVDIPIVILGPDRCVRSFTPPAEHLLGLISGDIGWPIGKLRSGINVPELDALISSAIEKGKESAREVQTQAGRWYSLRVRPFIPAEGKVQGVLMAFVDVDQMKRLQQETTERAEQSESTAEALLETAAQAILACNEEGRIRLANATAEKMFGYQREELVGKTLESLLPERFRTNHGRHRASWFAQPRHRPMGAGVELAGLRSDGSEFPIEVSLSFIGANQGRLGVAFISDITGRRESEKSLEEVREQLAFQVSALDRLRRTNDELWRSHDLRVGLEEILDAGMALLGAEMGNIQLLNPHKPVLEIAAQRGFGPGFLDYFQEVSAADDSACGRSLRTKERIIIEDVNLDAEFAPHRAAAAAAGFRAVQSTPLFGRDGRPIGMFSTHFRKPHRPSEPELVRFDLYASQAAQFIERLRSDAQLQRLTQALLVAREENNREIARELNDVFSQELIAVGMEIASLKKDGGPEASQRARLSKLSEKIVDIAKRLHETSRKLHPAVLEDLGLEPALRQACAAFEDTQGIPVKFAANNIPTPVPPDAALCLYRVAHESLRNIHKHAKETGKVWVSLAGVPGGITLTVKDQGDGFELDAALRKGGLGLISMEERVRAENGKLTIQSQPGKGTTVTAFVPLENDPLNARPAER